ncbi:C4-dicarboxylate ABC transporter substrate-binding protein [Ahrensia sp. R2A130]|uniref:C4-dicarboxylate ABC transporter substrate-binding protein n=1 Tax=Ahrensia sp. R2A130 TaxID=744979 RepID=UPI0001E0D8C7|nr:C4-dicarboxylate ABC transporter substrate-binding protein [Ahrensia sp. R2A130]EFL87533.1 trap dicarboxylate transporter- dctp subunit [Ahrensia sp. R2A130]
MKFTSLMKIAALALVTSTSSVLAEEVSISAVYSLPKTNDLMKSYLAFVEDVNANGKGVLQINLRGGTEVIPRNEQMNSVSRGIVDMYMGPAGYFQRQIPELAPLDAASVPADKLRAAGLHEAIDEGSRKRAGVAFLGVMGTGYAFQFYTIKEPKVAADGTVDLSGMKIRGGSSYDPMYKALDIARVDVPAGDIYTALERGLVEGIGFTTIGVSSGGWQEFLKYRIFPTWRQGNTILAMNAAKLDGLEDAQKSYLMEMVQKHEMLAYEAAQALEKVDTEKVQAAGVKDVVLTGAGEAQITNAFQDTFWVETAKTLGDEEAAKYRAIVDKANGS